MKRIYIAVCVLLLVTLACGVTAPNAPSAVVRLPLVYADRFEPPAADIGNVGRMYRLLTPTDRAGLWVLEER